MPLPQLEGISSVGRSQETILKVRQIAKVLPVVLGVGRTGLERSGGTLRLIDLNAACGRYEVDGETLEGSGLILPDFVDRLAIPHQVVLIERNPTLCEELACNLINGDYRLRHEGHHRDCIHILCGDNRELAPQVCTVGTSRDRGLVLFDANGEPDFDLAQSLSVLSSMRGVDFLIHVPTRTLKLITLAGRSSRFAGKGKWATRDLRSLGERMAAIDKRYWMVRMPYGRFDWTFLYGSNYRWKNGWAKEGFYWTDTPQGHNLLMRLSEPSFGRGYAGPLLVASND